MRIQEKPRALSGAPLRTSPRAREDRGCDENRRHDEYLSKKACPRGRIWNDVLRGFACGEVNQREAGQAG